MFRRNSDLRSLASESTLMTAASDDTQKPRWCNFLYATRCPFCSKTDANVDPCKFAHIDTYVNMDVEERQELGMPNLMTRHMRNLGREMTRIVDDKARRVLNAWMVVKAWGGADGTVSPYWDTVSALRNLGWVIPEVEQGAWTKLEDAPYARDVTTILGVVASSLHYNVNTSKDVMFRTVAWVFGEEAPVLNNPEPQLDVGDVHTFMGACVDAVSEVDATDDMPELLLEPMTPALAAADAPAPSDAVDETVPRQCDMTELTRRERRARVFAHMKTQKAQKAQAAREARESATKRFGMEWVATGVPLAPPAP
eukprot:TRINITY_DN2122_c0_g2_i3.p1 TRINITY_DN2122_c0_g2~~TRINITY_DN2122_c0_g2_i3.p1  ORF type:complete len:311 (+),score=102.34 TRINITY_DN2122_c0_g2_i3:57-989(+)